MNDKGQPDSAACYFGKAVGASANATDTTEMKIRNRSAFNQGALLLNAQKYDEAATRLRAVPQVGARTTPRPSAAWPRRTADWVSDEARRRRWRRSSWRPAAPRRAGPGGGGGAGTQDLMNVGVNLYNDKKYAEAATAFEKVVAAEPYNRDALFEPREHLPRAQGRAQAAGHGSSSWSRSSR